VERELFYYLRKILPIFGILILIIIIISLDIDKIINSFLSIEPKFIIYSLLLTIPKILLLGISWKIMLNEQKIRISFWYTIKIYLIGIFYGSITPGFLGHLMRAPYVKEKTNEPYGKIFVNMYIEVALRTIALFLLIITGTLLVIGRYPQLFILSSIGFLITIIIYVYLFKKERGEKLFYLFIKYLIPKRFKVNFYKFIDTFYDDFPRFWILLFPLFIGLLIWVVVFTQEYFMVIALGLNIPYISFLVLFPIANIAGYLPITLGGLGTRELTSIVIFTSLYNVTSEDVLVFTLMGFIITDIFTGIIGFFVSLTETKKDISVIEKYFKD
jgi:uncharacterized protein (TIRG00374 family)